ncbi:holo-ACP synthase [Amycolatopsis sp. SID8362]|uniref:holo-ACP synthase n=1 Tax=Amycolatopsis sp. SID8362 TaxID=2690346 RepID=UPI00136F77E7|nr:holo-ACP synthase [Amycolatopsis sp. SID8362]NBH03206.1 4'-phosphopantetheinyl transferase superfamily protein [Amycolatopsis sp. SID8362]NED39907.1 holo-ACP synthase [Amycolatopsis sp. SID8362]
MPTKRIGIDVVPLSRVRELVGPDSGPALRRMLSPAELLNTSTPDGPDMAGIAGRLAAKEAVFKLFHVGGQPVPWLSTEVLKDDGGWPVVRLSGRAARLAAEAGLGEIEISITHDDAYAIAVAVSAAD